MKDKNGEPLTVGAICVYVPLPNKDDPDRAKYAGRKVIVRDMSQRMRGQGAKSIFGQDHVRVDDDIEQGDDANAWGWAAWVNPNELVVIAISKSSAPLATC